MPILGKGLGVHSVQDIMSNFYFCHNVFQQLLKPNNHQYMPIKRKGLRALRSRQQYIRQMCTQSLSPLQTMLSL